MQVKAFDLIPYFSADRWNFIFDMQCLISAEKRVGLEKITHESIEAVYDEMVTQGLIKAATHASEHNLMSFHRLYGNVKYTMCWFTDEGKTWLERQQEEYQKEPAD